MALDNAEFISELSIVDPPGTDPLNQGDDHIRTTKKAVQQSFPNVNAAVPQTAAQMGQMAIKNEVNVFTQANDFATGQLFRDEIRIQQITGFGGNVRYQTDLGVVRWQATHAASQDYELNRFSAAGAFTESTMIVRASTGNVIWGAGALQFAPDGTASVPAYSFGNNSDMGMYRVQADFLGFAVGGARQFQIGTGGINAFTNINGVDGTAAAPAYAFSSQSDQGMYNATFNELGLAAGGVQVARLGPGSAVFPASMFAGAGSAATPGYTFDIQSNMGMYRSASNVLAFATAGVQRATMTGSEFQYFAPMRAVDGSSANNGYGFQGAPTMGISKVGTSLVISVNSLPKITLKANGHIRMDIPLFGTGQVAGDLFFDQSQNYVPTDFIVGITQ